MPETPTTKQRRDFITTLRPYGVPDNVLGALLGISKQRVNVIGGRRPEKTLPAIEAAPLPEALAAFRARHKLSQEALGALLGTSETNVHNWETYKTSCSFEKTVRLALLALDKMMGQPT